MDADARFLLGTLCDVCQNDNAACRCFADLIVLIDFAGNREIFLVMRDVIKILIGLVARVATENHIAAVVLRPDGQRMPETIFVNGLEDERILVWRWLSKEVPCFWGWLQELSWQDCLEIGRENLVDTVFFGRGSFWLRRFRRGFLHELLEFLETFF